MIKRVFCEAQENKGASGLAFTHDAPTYQGFPTVRIIPLQVDRSDSAPCRAAPSESPPRRAARGPQSASESRVSDLADGGAEGRTLVMPSRGASVGGPERPFGAQ